MRKMITVMGLGPYSLLLIPLTQAASKIGATDVVVAVEGA
jgi:hypothetical protein